VKKPFTLAPDKIQIVDVALIAVVKSDLVLRPVVLELPIGRRGNDKVHRTVRQQIHLPAVAFYYGVTGFQRLGFCLGHLEKVIPHPDCCVVPTSRDRNPHVLRVHSGFSAPSVLLYSRSLRSLKSPGAHDTFSRSPL